MGRHRWRWSIPVVCGCMLVGLLYLFPAYGNWLIPFPTRVTVAELHTAPDRYVNRLVEIHGVVQWGNRATCDGSDMGTFFVLDSPIQHPNFDPNNPMPPTAISLETVSIDLAYISTFDHVQPIVLSGRFRHRTFIIREMEVRCIFELPPKGTVLTSSHIDTSQIWLDSK